MEQKSAYKSDIMTEVAAVLSFSAIYNNDKIGVIFFSDKVEKFIPPLKGRKHILRIIRELLDFTPESKKTNLDEPLRFLTNAIKKRCTAFIISDFMVPGFEEALRIASNKHDIVALKVYDPLEQSIPDIGLDKSIRCRNRRGKMDRYILGMQPGRHMKNGGPIISRLSKIFSKDAE